MEKESRGENIFKIFLIREMCVSRVVGRDNPVNQPLLASPPHISARVHATNKQPGGWGAVFGGSERSLALLLELK